MLLSAHCVRHGMSTTSGVNSYGMFGCNVGDSEIPRRLRQQSAAGTSAERFVLAKVGDLSQPRNYLTRSGVKFLTID